MPTHIPTDKICPCRYIFVPASILSPHVDTERCESQEQQYLRSKERAHKYTVRVRVRHPWNLNSAVANTLAMAAVPSPRPMRSGCSHYAYSNSTMASSAYYYYDPIAYNGDQQQQPSCRQRGRCRHHRRPSPRPLPTTTSSCCVLAAAWMSTTATRRMAWRISGVVVAPGDRG